MRASQPGSLPQAAVTFRTVSKSFNGHQALKNVDLEISPGAFVALVGASGCGKSTALRLAAGLIAPTAGSVSARGGAGHDGDIGFVFQDPTLMPWATVFDNVALPLTLKGASRSGSGDAVMNALQRVGLSARADAYPRELSGGMKMRVSIARALVTAPSLLLMDEPFAALDEITREALDAELLDLWQTLGCTVLFVTHSIYEAVYLAERIAVLPQSPGPAVAEIEVPEPHPRAPSFKTTSRFGAICAKVSDALSRGRAERGQSEGDQA